MKKGVKGKKISPCKGKQTEPHRAPNTNGSRPIGHRGQTGRKTKKGNEGGKEGMGSGKREISDSLWGQAWGHTGRETSKELMKRATWDGATVIHKQVVGCGVPGTRRRGETRERDAAISGCWGAHG